MAKNKPVGAGADVSVNVLGDLVLFETVGCTTSITPPPQVRTDIDVTCQQDDSTDAEPGIEQLSQAQFIEPMDPTFTPSIDDLYANKSKVPWELTFKRGTDFELVIRFTGYVSGITPAAAGGNDGLNRTITITRTGPIEYNPA